MSDAAPLPAAPAERRLDVDTRRAFASVRAPSLAVGIAVASGIALVLGLIRLGAPSLWFDEAFTADAVHRSPEWWFDNDQYHVLYDAVSRAWTSFAGTSEWALRLPSVFGAMAACALLVVLARKVFDGWVALVSGILLATSPFLVKWSQQARGYTLLLAVSLVATLCLLRALERGTRGSWALYGVAISATVVWHAVAGLLLVPAHLVLIAQRRQKLLPHGPLAAVIFLAVAVPWAATIAMRSTGAGVGMNWLTAPSPSIVAHAVLDISGAAGLGLLLAVVGLVVLRLARRTDLAVWLGVWAFAPFVLALRPVERAADLPRPLHHRRRSRVRPARGRRGDRHRATARRCRSGSGARGYEPRPGCLVSDRRSVGTGAGRTGAVPSASCSRGVARRTRSSSSRGQLVRRPRTTAHPSRPRRPPTRSGCSPGRRPADDITR